MHIRPVVNFCQTRNLQGFSLTRTRSPSVFLLPRYRTPDVTAAHVSLQSLFTHDVMAEPQAELLHIYFKVLILTEQGTRTPKTNQQRYIITRQLPGNLSQMAILP